MELLTPPDLEDEVNWWGQAGFWVPAIEYVQSMVIDQSVEQKQTNKNCDKCDGQNNSLRKT